MSDIKRGPLTSVCISELFIDDGCTNAPDSLFGFDLSDACRTHDWRYCSRCHTAGSMTKSWQRAADKELRRNLASLLPWRWRWAKWVYYGAVWRYGGFGSFDSCGPSVGVRCRHGCKKPGWMEWQARQQQHYTRDRIEREKDDA